MEVLIYVNIIRRQEILARMSIGKCDILNLNSFDVGRYGVLHFME